MTKKVFIPIQNGQKLLALENTIESNKAILFVHGLTGHPYEHQFYNAVSYFTNQGYDVIRLWLYSEEEGARPLIESSIQTHARDIGDALQFYREKYETVFLVGHSLAGPSIMKSKHSVPDGIVLWDPSTSLEPWKEEFTWNQDLECYRVEWGVTFLLSSELYNEWLEFSEEIAKHITTPIKLIYATELHRHIKNKLLDACSSKIKELVVIEDDHIFSEKEEELFKETLDFFEKLSP